MWKGRVLWAPIADKRNTEVLVSIAVSIAVLLIVFHKEGIKFVVDVWNKLFPRSFKSEPTPELRRVFRHRLSDEHSMC